MASFQLELIENPKVPLLSEITANVWLFRRDSTSENCQARSHRNYLIGNCKLMPPNTCNFGCPTPFQATVHWGSANTLMEVRLRNNQTLPAPAPIGTA